MTGHFAIAEHHPQRPALVGPDEEQVSYGELAVAANRIASGLQSLGLERGDTLAVVLPNGRLFMEVYAAAMQIGLYIVAVNWHLTGSEILYILSDSDAKALIAHARFASACRDAVDRAKVPEHARFCVGHIPGFRPLADLVSGTPDTRPKGRSAGQVMFYTSGTTGRPKGVRKPLPELSPDTIGVGVRSAPAGRAARRPAAQPSQPLDQVHLVCGPLYHGAPIGAASGVLDNGALLVLIDKWTPERFLELIERHRVTHASMVPTMFHRLLALPESSRRAADVSSLVSVTHAGAPCPIDVKRRMIEWWGPIINEYYSSSEGSMPTTVTSEEWLLRPGTVGRPGPGNEIKIYDEEGHECPPGVPGIVYLTPLWEFEYHKDPDKTRESRRGKLFTVGDIGYLDDEGYLFLCDRQADVIISGGVNIYPAEVEGALLEHAAVGDVAVVGVPNEEWGEEVRAVVEAVPGIGPGPELERELIAFCRERIAGFKCPRSIDFVEQLGRDPNGKLRKRPIRDRYWAGRARKI